MQRWYEDKDTIFLIKFLFDGKAYHRESGYIDCWVNKEHVNGNTPHVLSTSGGF